MHPTAVILAGGLVLLGGALFVAGQPKWARNSFFAALVVVVADLLIINM